MPQPHFHPSGGYTHTAVMIALCLMPLLLLMLVLASGMPVSPWFFLLFLLLCIFGMYVVVGRQAAAETPGEAVDQPPPTEEVPEELILMTVDIIYPLASYRVADRYVIEGTLLLKPNAAYQELQQRFAGSALTPLLQESEAGRPMLVLVPDAAFAAPAQRKSRAILSGVLFFATLVTTTWAGAAHQGADLLEQPGQLGTGLPYALALMLILGAHELGHYFTARHYGMQVSLPFFIPVPFALGTFGAFIQMKSLARDRRQMFDVSVAGPLAGLVIAVPALLVGLRYSSLGPEAAVPSMFAGGADVGSSMLLAFLSKAALGDAVLEGHRLILHPIAFAGWLGLLVTALNLIPVGQLGGGHLVHALLGQGTARIVGIVALMALVILGLFVWSGLLVWALLIFFIAGTRDAPPRNDVSRLGRGRMVLGAAAFVLLLLILIPVPHALYAAFGIHCPYA